MQAGEGVSGDRVWSSHGMAPQEALRRWRSWASETLAPLQIAVPDEAGFSARWKCHALGPLQLVSLKASPQHVVHNGQGAAQPAEGRFQLVYCRRTPIEGRVGATPLRLNAGEFVIVDNADHYEMRMDDEHEAIDLVMPSAWLERWAPDLDRYLGRPICAKTRWGRPLGSLLETLASEIETAPMPRLILADHVGPLLALAIGGRLAPDARHRDKLLRRLLHLIAERYQDADLDPGEVAKAAGISKRYLHALLADAGETFLGVLTRVRLDRASELLADRRMGQLQVAEIAWRCGYADPSYFARVFRRRFGAGPREWRSTRQH